MDHNCKHCGAALKTGLISSNGNLLKSRLRVINLAQTEQRDSACNKCGDEIYKASRQSLERESYDLQQRLKGLLPRVLVVSLQSPMGWIYEPITIVTAQTVTGTGVFSDVASAFTDLFGTQSGAYNAKLREGEDLCKASLRAQAIELGGNAIIGVDIDYAEVGGTRAMLMVCMTGTAVRVSELSSEDEDFFNFPIVGCEMARRAREIQAALKAPDY